MITVTAFGTGMVRSGAGAHGFSRKHWPSYAIFLQIQIMLKEIEPAPGELARKTGLTGGLKTHIQ